MEFTEARQAMVDNLQKQPQEFERQLETLFLNPHFGDVVTEVFPAVLDPHDRGGRSILKKYTELAGFLESSKEVDDAILVALRVETENIEYDRRNPRQGIKAFALRYYKGLRAEDFQVERGEDSAPIGIRIDHESYTAASGWKNEQRIYNTEQAAVVDSTLDSDRWRREPLTEQESPVYYLTGMNSNQIDAKVREVDHSLRLMGEPLWGVLLEMEGEALYRKAGREPKNFLPVETQS